MERAEVTKEIAAARLAAGLSWAELAAAVGRSPEWTTAALHGQAAMSEDEAEKVVGRLGLGSDAALALQQPPTKGSIDPLVPVDPLLYRFYEILQVYGSAIKALIHEEFGDGIMSAIDFEYHIERKADPKGDRVVVTMDGKFLPYRKW